jgi:Family of unknown function (DUF6074)
MGRPSIDMSAAPLRRACTWLDQVLSNPAVTELATAVAMLIADTADRFGCAPRPNPKRIAGELGERLPAVVAAIAELTKQGYLELLPRGAGRRCRLVMAGGGPETPAAVKIPTPADIIPYDQVERRRRSADQHAQRMAAMPHEQADAYLQRLLRDREKVLRRRGAREAMIGRELQELKSSICAAYWRAVLTPSRQ